MNEQKLSEWIQDGIKVSKETEDYTLQTVLELIYEHVIIHEGIIFHYIELLEAMKRRDPKLDPIWMEQFATATLRQMRKEETE